MSTVCARPVVQQRTVCNTSNCSDFLKTDNSNYLQLRFTSKMNPLQSWSLRSNQEARAKNLANSTSSAHSLMRDLSFFFTGETPLPRTENIRVSGCRGRSLCMNVQCVSTDFFDESTVQHACLTTSIASQLSAKEGTCSGSYADSSTLDKWLRDSVFEIVRHLKEAPFIQFVHDSESACRKPERQKVSPGFFSSTDLWTVVKKSILQSSPIGLILVQKLDQQMLTRVCLAENAEGCNLLSPSSNISHNSEGTTDVWGILVEGQNIVWNACYILKTTRVTSCAGVCTHFCLTRAKCFGPTLQQQLEKIWLL